MNLHTIQNSAVTATIQGSVDSSVASAVSSGPSTASLLPAPTSALFSGDMAAQIAALALQQGQAQSDLDTKAEETQDSIADQADAAEVATMHQEASTMRAGAWESGILQISAGACSIASAGAGIGATAGSGAMGASGVMKGLSEGLSGGGTIAGGLSKAATTDLEASATASKALADAAQRSGGVDSDAKKSAQQFVQAAVDFFREYESTKAQAQAAAVHGA